MGVRAEHGIGGGAESQQSAVLVCHKFGAGGGFHHLVRLREFPRLAVALGGVIEYVPGVL